MKIIPPVLFLTFAGFLPNDCDAMYRYNVMGRPTVNPEVSGTIVVTSKRGTQFRHNLEMYPEGVIDEPDFFHDPPTLSYARYRACLITFPDLMHKSPDLYSETARQRGYTERTYKPKSVEVMALNIHYDEFDLDWQEYIRGIQPHPLLSSEYARLFITIPNTKTVLHKLFIQRPPGVNYDGVRNAALLAIYNRFNRQFRALAALPSHTWK